MKMSKKTKKMINRSGKSPCPICNKPEVLEEHHIEGRKIPNAEHSSNLASICPNCHTKVHLGRVIIEGWFQTTSGLELFWHEENEESFTGRESKPYIVGK